MSRSDGIHLMEYGEAIALAEPLLRSHWQELATDKELMVLAPASEVYEELDRSGTLFVLGLFRDGDMVGYSANIVHPHLHYSGLIVCQNDVIFVDPDYRNGGDGVRLLAATEREARKRGARLILMHAKPDTPFDALLRRLKGYRVQDVIHSRRL